MLKRNLFPLATAVLFVALLAASVAAKVDYSERLYPVTTLAPATYKVNKSGTGVDLQGYNAATVLIVAATWTNGSHAFDVQESADNSDWDSVAATDLQGTEPTVSSSGTANQTYWVGYTGDSRYLRVASTVSGSPATGAIYGAVILRGEPKYGPTR